MGKNQRPDTQKNKFFLMTLNKKPFAFRTNDYFRVFRRRA